jgi:hypothetical protein
MQINGSNSGNIAPASGVQGVCDSEQVELDKHSLRLLLLEKQLGGDLSRLHGLNEESDESHTFHPRLDKDGKPVPRAYLPHRLHNPYLEKERSTSYQLDKLLDKIFKSKAVAKLADLTINSKQTVHRLQFKK